MADEDLESAYALNSEDDVKRLYGDWAQTYDDDFRAEMDFVAPQRVAEAFQNAGGQGPILDFGAGTGAMGEELTKLRCGPIDAVDLSPEMLKVAGSKGIYRDLIEGNLLDGLVIEQRYKGVVSSGTFTHGHVGPEAFDPLLALADPGAVFALSVKVEHFDGLGFADALAGFGKRIADLKTSEVRIYGAGNAGPHRDDTCFVVTFMRV